MSFDCMVFDAAAAPKDKDGFKSWAEAEIESKADLDKTVLGSEALSSFYEQLRNMFTPINGPDDVALPENSPQVRILRTCEYAFRPRSIYMCFRWAAQDMARGACSTFASELGLGFYNLSNRYPQARFPDGAYVYPFGNWKDEELRGKS